MLLFFELGTQSQFFLLLYLVTPPQREMLKNSKCWFLTKLVQTSLLSLHYYPQSQSYTITYYHLRLLMTVCIVLLWFLLTFQLIFVLTDPNVRKICLG